MNIFNFELKKYFKYISFEILNIFCIICNKIFKMRFIIKIVMII